MACIINLGSSDTYIYVCASTRIYMCEYKIYLMTLENVSYCLTIVQNGMLQNGMLQNGNGLFCSAKCALRAYERRLRELSDVLIIRCINTGIISDVLISLKKFFRESIQ